MTGQCNICGWRGEFLQPQLLREGTLCGNCSSSSRHRMVMYALSAVLHSRGRPVYEWSRNKDLRILESSARGSYPPMLEDKFDYYNTEYDPGKIAKGKDPRHFADFQKLHYDDDMFDLVIASDVFEHVRHDERGYREIFRVLKKGGSFILTVPYNHQQAETVKRVDTTGDEDVHILEPEYHGGGGHTLTYRNYGQDLLSLLRSIGFSVAYVEGEVAAHGITFQSLILCAKADYVNCSGLVMDEPSSHKSIGMLLPYRLFLLFKYNIKGFVHYLKEVRR